MFYYFFFESSKKLVQSPYKLNSKDKKQIIAGWIFTDCNNADFEKFSKLLKNLQT